MTSRSTSRRSGLAVWFTGLSGAGKSTLANALAAPLRQLGYAVEILDGDEVRQRLSPDLGFCRADREENIRRIGIAAQEAVRRGSIVLVAAIAPYRAMRWEVRSKIGPFLEVYVNAPIEVCMERDPKGLYRRALAGEITHFTGVSDPYEPPVSPEVECSTAAETVAQSTEKVLAAVNLVLEQPATSTTLAFQDNESS